MVHGVICYDTIKVLFTMKMMLLLISCTLLLPALSPAAEPDSLLVTDISRDTVDQAPRGWTQDMPKKQKVFTSYMVEYTEKGPYVRATSNSSGSWMDKDMGDLDVRKYPVMVWDWMVNTFPEVEWEKKRDQDDFALRVELLYDYPGGGRSLWNIIRKGFITSLFRGNPPMLTVSYVWSVGVPTGEEYRSPSAEKTVVVPVESGNTLVRRWVHQERNIRDDLKRMAPEEKNLVLKKIRIRCDTENSHSKAEGGVRNIVLIPADGDTKE
jgi:hypothetical protein